MYTLKDIEFRSIFVINCLERRGLRVSNGELLLEDVKQNKVLTKMPFQKILALFVIGHITITTPLIEKCKQYNVALVVMKPNLRPIFYWADAAEGNFLLRKRQYTFENSDISVARHIVQNKVSNQLKLLHNTRIKQEYIEEAKVVCESIINRVPATSTYTELLGLEGEAAKYFFESYYRDFEWKGRKPRIKSDPLNLTLDIGYTILFNFMESFIRMFGFDLYIGVYHRMWFKRKSLVCDLIEPFRCIIDQQIRKSFNTNEFKPSDFILIKNEYFLKHEKSADYYKVFYNALILYRNDIFKYVQTYYRCFMKGDFGNNFPEFNLN